MAKKSSDRFVRMYGPILDELRKIGGEGTAREIMRAVADLVITDPEERDRLTKKSGANAAENEVAWARNNLREAGLIDGSTRGVWRLTPEGWKTHLTLEDAHKIGKNKQIKDRQAKLDLPEDDVDVLEVDEIEEVSEKSLLATIKELPPKGFERLCQRILRELGFSEVRVTGSSGDGGIDGDGVLKVNELVSMRVLFQCKRYEKSVSSKELRDFRGAMSGRTDKGIFLTTGTFTSEAQKEAVREGVPPIELVDGERLVHLMEAHKLGVKPRVVYDVDDAFFEPFRSSI